MNAINNFALKNLSELLIQFSYLKSYLIFTYLIMIAIIIIFYYRFSFKYLIN